MLKDKDDLKTDSTIIDHVNMLFVDKALKGNDPLIDDNSQKDGGQTSSENFNASDSIIAEGSEVMIIGLTSEQGKKMNGKKALVLAWIPDAGRYLLKLNKEQTKKRLKATNVKFTGNVSELLWDDIVLTAKLLNREIPISREKRVDICKFTFGKQIGAGPISRIILATKDPSYNMGEDTSIDKVALKAISKVSLADRRKATMLQRALMYEKKTMYKCRDIHPFILSLYATAIGMDDLYFVLEYAPNNDLQWWSRELGGLPEPCVRFYAACIVDALEAMHKLKVYHRDVKPENVFLDKDYLPKLGDFGCSIIEGDVINFMGTPQYMAPEMVRHQVDLQNVRATDYWSLGATVYFLLFGKLAFTKEHNYDVMDSVRNCEYKMLEGGDEIIKNFIEKLMVVNINDRLGWQDGWTEIKKHDIFKDIDWISLLRSKEPPVKFWEGR